MTEQEFERLRRRFGADVSAWPAPFRQEAIAHGDGAGAAAQADEALDRLVLEAAAGATDEAVLARKVLASINGEGRSIGLLRLWTMPAAASGFAALLLLAAVAGYTAADRQLDAADDLLLAFALGGGGAVSDGSLLGEFGEGAL